MSEKTKNDIQYWTNVIIKWAATIVISFFAFVGKQVLESLDRFDDKIDTLAERVNSIEGKQSVLEMLVGRNIKDIEEIQKGR